MANYDDGKALIEKELEIQIEEEELLAEKVATLRALDALIASKLPGANQTSAAVSGRKSSSPIRRLAGR